jgi:serine/threonine protein kinase
MPTDSTPPASAPDQPPIPVPEHKMIRRIGRGASGEVWLARNALGAYRAVKIVRPRDEDHLSASEFDGVLKFEPISRLHEGLVDILQAGRNEQDGIFYYVMELGDDIKTGQSVTPETYSVRTLNHDIHGRGRLPVRECIRLGAELASALGFLHRQRLTHRDVKPSNIIYINSRPKLADVGLVASMNQSRGRAGTTGFVPPEGSGTAQGDIYSLGKVLYEMCTGNSAEAYPAMPTDMGTAKNDLELAQFLPLIVRACRTSPAKRYASTDEFMTALLSFQYLPPPSPWRRGGPVERAVARVGLVVGVAFVIFILGRLFWLLLGK